MSFFLRQFLSLCWCNEVLLCALCVCVRHVCARCVPHSNFFFFLFFREKKKGKKKHSELKADYSLHLAVIISAPELPPLIPRIQWVEITNGDAHI